MVEWDSIGTDTPYCVCVQERETAAGHAEVFAGGMTMVAGFGMDKLPTSLYLAAGSSWVGGQRAGIMSYGSIENNSNSRPIVYQPYMTSRNNPTAC